MKVKGIIEEEGEGVKKEGESEENGKKELTIET
jgi:hypothetical protein